MDRVLSARVDETVLEELNRATKQRGITKKQFLEEAIRDHAARTGAASGPDVWTETCGLWQCPESVPTTIRRARTALESSMRRHQWARPRRR